MQTSQKEDVLDTHERILLSERDFAQFVACLEKRNRLLLSLQQH